MKTLCFQAWLVRKFPNGAVCKTWVSQKRHTLKKEDNGFDTLSQKEAAYVTARVKLICRETGAAGVKVNIYHANSISSLYFDGHGRQCRFSDIRGY